MSAGRFSRARYDATYDADAIHPIRVQPETLAFATQAVPPVTNASPAGAVTNPISALASLNKRARGLHPRYVTIQLADGELPPSGYASGAVAKVVILQESLYNSLTIGQPVTYLSSEWEVVSKSPEEAN